MDLNQVLIEVTDFRESIDFYSLLGFRLIVSERDEYARFELPSGSTTFSICVSNKPVISSTTLYLEVENIDQKFEELRKLGVEFDAPPVDQPFRWRTAYFCDPSGNQWCLFHAGAERRFPPWRIES